MRQKGGSRVCSVEGCTKALRARSFCATHWARWRKYGTPELPKRPERLSKCMIDGCSRDAERGLGDSSVCNAHYFRMRRSGSYGVTSIGEYVSARDGRIMKFSSDGICEVSDCDAASSAYGYCEKHATRYRRHGDPETYIEPEERNMPHGEANRRWTGDAASYGAVHMRLRCNRGPASKYSCVDCGEGARHWSYNHKSENERISDLGPYSVDLGDYEPRCVRCHFRFDRMKRAEGSPK